MKKNFLFLITLCLAITLQAQVSKIDTVTGDGLTFQENALSLYLIIGKNKAWDNMSFYCTSVMST
jgi:hypothetical protein